MTEAEIRSRLEAVRKEERELLDKLAAMRGSPRTFTPELHTFTEKCKEIGVWHPDDYVKLRKTACSVATNGRTEKVTQLIGDEISAARDILQFSISKYIEEHQEEGRQNKEYTDYIMTRLRRYG